MAFQWRDLSPAIREFMLDECEQDIAQGKLYNSKRFTPAGCTAYLQILRDALLNGDEQSLADALRACGAFKSHEERQLKTGKVTVAAVPTTAADTFASGEFNRFYMRALCRHAVASGKKWVTVYRASAVANPRPESTAMLGMTLQAEQLLEDLRRSTGVDTALGLPPGPNSGLSVHL